MDHPCWSRGCASPIPILCLATRGARGVSGCLLPTSPLPLLPAPGFLFKDASHRSSQYFCLLAMTAASSLIIYCLGWVASWFPPSQRSPSSLPTRRNLSKKIKRTVKAISGRARASGFPSAAWGARSGENFHLPRETCPAAAETWEDKASGKGRGGRLGTWSPPRGAAWLQAGLLQTQPVLLALWRVVQRRETGL